MVGIVFSAFYVPWVARRWQHRQRALEVKAELVSKMPRCVMTFDAELKHRARTLVARPPTAAGASAASIDIGEVGREFDVCRCVIGTELEAYFPEAKGFGISRAWTRFTDLFLEFSALPVRDPSRRNPQFAVRLAALTLTHAEKQQARREAARFPDLDPDWSVVEQLLLAEKLRLIVAVMTTPMRRLTNT